MDINKDLETARPTGAAADLSLERLAGLAKIINGFKEGGRAAESPKRREAEIFDPLLDTPALKTIKAAIPYIDRRYRRELGVMVKLIEIDRLLNSFKGTAATSIEGNGDSMAMLRAIVPNLPNENKQMGETLVKLLEIKGIWDMNEGVGHL